MWFWFCLMSLCSQGSTGVPQSAGSDSVHEGRHYHGGLPTAQQGLLRLFQQDGPEDLGPKAVSTIPEAGWGAGETLTRPPSRR